MVTIRIFVDVEFRIFVGLFLTIHCRVVGCRIHLRKNVFGKRTMQISIYRVCVHSVNERKMYSSKLNNLTATAGSGYMSYNL